MASKLDIRIELDTVKLKRLHPFDDPVPKPWAITKQVNLGNAQATDCVPYSNEFNGDIGNPFVFFRQHFDGGGIQGVLYVSFVNLAETFETRLGQ